MRYAENTTVPAARSAEEIEHLVKRYGATEFARAWQMGRAVVQFAVKDRRVKFLLPLPTSDEILVGLKDTRRWRHQKPPQVVVDDLIEQETKRRWRCLVLAIKSKLEVVQSGIETFDEAFFANLVTETGATLFEHIMTGNGPKLLGPAGE